MPDDVWRPEQVLEFSGCFVVMGLVGLYTRIFLIRTAYSTRPEKLISSWWKWR